MALRPLLARGGELPTRDGWAYEVKWDGFRAIVSTEDGLRVRSRRGWNMTLQLLELADLPEGLVLDGEIVALNDDGLPHFPLVCRRLLHGDGSVPLVLMIFDVLVSGGDDLTRWPYVARRLAPGCTRFEGGTGAHRASAQGTTGTPDPVTMPLPRVQAAL